MSIPLVSYSLGMKRRMVGVVVIGLLLAIAAAVFLARCPWSTCGYLNLYTYTITTLGEYRRFLANEAAFKALHHVAAVRLDCSALRDDVVTSVQIGRLMLGLSKPAVPEDMAQPGLFRAWRQGRVLHLVNAAPDDKQEQEAWAASVQEMVVSQKQDELSFLPRLFGGLIIHISGGQKPIVLFSDEPCP
jgi:hypothetical protein